MLGSNCPRLELDDEEEEEEEDGEDGALSLAGDGGSGSCRRCRCWSLSVYSSVSALRESMSKTCGLFIPNDIQFSDGSNQN